MALPDAFLHAFSEPLAGLAAVSPTTRLVDVAGDGDVRLVVADLSQRLRVFRGTAQSSSHPLLDAPCAVAAFYPDAALPRVPSLAIAAGAFVYIYRGLRPYLKFSLPVVPVAPAEVVLWDALWSGAADAEVTAAALTALRDEGTPLSARALDLVLLSPGTGERSRLAETFRGKPLLQHTVVTAMEAIHREREGDGEVSSLVVATEARQLLFLDAIGSTVQSVVTLPAVATHLACFGTLSSDHRVHAACRDGAVYAVRDMRVSHARFEPPTMPSAIVRTATELVVGGMGGSLSGYAARGGDTPLVWSLTLPAPITAMTRVHVHRGGHGADCVAVALEGGAVHVYRGRELVASLTAPDTVTALRFGQFGREANSLVLVTRSGALLYKVLRRTATLEGTSGSGGGAAEGKAGEGSVNDPPPLQIPRKTRLALVQGAREVELAGEVHRGFQRGLLKLRLNVAKEYLRVMPPQAGGDGTTSVGATAATSAGLSGVGAIPIDGLRVSCDVLGLGPVFSLRISVANGGTVPIESALLLLSQPPLGDFTFPVGALPLPLLLPHTAPLLLELAITRTPNSPVGTSGEVFVLLALPRKGAAGATVSADSCRLLVATTVLVPPNAL